MLCRATSSEGRNLGSCDTRDEQPRNQSYLLSLLAFTEQLQPGVQTTPRAFYFSPTKLILMFVLWYITMANLRVFYGISN